MVNIEMATGRISGYALPATVTFMEKFGVAALGSKDEFGALDFGN
jgi:hypothetical protein